MTPLLQNKLYATYPKLFAQHQNKTTTLGIYGIQCEDGYYNTLDKLCNYIQWYVDQKQIHQPQFEQIKTKFNRLRIYYTDGDATISHLVTLAESLADVLAPGVYGCFGEWFYSQEGFHLVAERFYDDVKAADPYTLRGWLETAYLQGQQDALHLQS